MKTNAPNKTLLAATCAVLLAGSHTAWAAIKTTVRIYGSSTASGFEALCNMSTLATTAAGNTAHGYQALKGNSKDSGSNIIYITGTNNTATGNQALYFNTTGNNNTATGNQALYYNTTGKNNTANGAFALNNNTTGYNNTAFGRTALPANTTGYDNTATGLLALQNNTRGNYNTAYGSSAHSNNLKGINNTVNGAAISSGGADNNNTVLGASANINSSLSTLSANNNTIIGYYARIAQDLTNATIIADQPDLIYIKTATRKVRIGNTAVQKIEGQVPWSSTSDKRLKSNIVDLPLGLDFISKLRPVEYIRNNNTEKTKEWGLIAQELQQTLKDVGYKDAGVVSEDKTPDKYLTVRYNDLLAPMIKAIQELKKEKTELQKIDQEQQKTIKALFKRLETLEKKAK